MKKVLDAKLRTILGKPFSIPDVEGERNSQMFVCPKCGQPSEKTEMVAEARLSQVLKLIAINIPRDKLTMQDSIYANNFFNQVRGVDGVMSIEDAEHSWLLKIVEAYGTGILGINASIVKDAVSDFKRENPPTKVAKEHYAKDAKKEA